MHKYVKWDSINSLFLWASTSLLCFILYPHIGVGDVDAYAYVVGAKGMQAGLGYKSLEQMSFYHWPPGYSYLLSFFSDVLSGAKIINYTALGGISTLIYLLAVKHSWSRLTGFALSVGLTFNFFLNLALFAKPDVLCYLIFFLGAYLYFVFNLHVPAFILWALCIPLKLIAVVFIPGVLLIYFYSHRKVLLNRESLFAFFLWLVSIMTVVYLNFRETGTGISVSHEGPNSRVLYENLVMFGFSFARDLLSSWHGSIKDPLALSLFLGGVIFTGLCFFNLRLNSSSAKIRTFSWTVVGLSWVLQLIRTFHATMRLMGYGVILFIFSLRPKEKGRFWWVVFAAFMLLKAMINYELIPHEGINHPRWKRVAEDFATKNVNMQDPLATNSFYLLDLQVGVSTKPIYDLSVLKQGDYYFWINPTDWHEPTSVIQEVQKPGGEDFRVIFEMQDAILFQKR